MITVHPFVPLGYLQSYAPHNEAEHPYRDQPLGSLGVDLFIGEPHCIRCGYGRAALQAFADRSFADGVPRLLVDPSPDNVAAIGAYAKAGFRSIGPRDSVFGHVLLMICDAPQSRRPRMSTP